MGSQERKASEASTSRLIPSCTLYLHNKSSHLLLLLPIFAVAPRFAQSQGSADSLKSHGLNHFYSFIQTTDTNSNCLPYSKNTNKATGNILQKQEKAAARARAKISATHFCVYE